MSDIENNIVDPELHKYELVPIDKLVPYANNARTHSEEQVKRVAESIQEFGWTYPILIDKKFNVIAGHGRIEAAKLIGYKNLPAMFIEGMTDLQKRAYILADNKLAELAGWDQDMLQYELNALNIEGFDVALTGFELDDIAIDDIAIDEDPEGSRLDGDTELKAETMAQLGDVFQLGRHRLMCGTALDLDDVGQLMEGSKASMAFTDPSVDVKDLPEFLDEAFRSMKEATADNAPAYVCYPALEHRVFETALEDNGWKLRSQIIWVKNLAGAGQYKLKHEPILYLTPSGESAPWYGNKKQTSTWDYQPSDEELL